MLVLRLLENKEMSGYNLMKYIGQSMGRKPSAGSMYPLLEELKNSGLINSKESGKSKIYFLAKEGKNELSKTQDNKDECFRQVVSSVKMYCMFSGEKESECSKKLVDYFEKERRDAIKQASQQK